MSGPATPGGRVGVLRRTAVCAGERRTTASLYPTASCLAALGIERHRTTDLAPRRGSPALTSQAPERSRGGVRSDLLETRPEALGRFQMSALAALLCPQTSDAGPRYQEQDKDIDHARLPPKLSLAL